MTIKSRTIILTVAMVVAVLAAYFIGSSRPGASNASAAESSAAADTVTSQMVMTGTGEATGVPDQLVFGVTVTQTAGDVSTALDQAASTAHRVVAALTDVGVASKDMQTTGLSVRPQYDYVNGTSVLTGYTASENLSVVVEKLSDAGDAITKAVDAGGNAVRVGNVQLKIGDTDALLAKARADAVTQATDKAQQYADATGSTLGSVVSVKEVSSSRPTLQPVFARSLAGDAAALKSIPIKAGSADLKVTVKVVWSLS